MLQTSALKKQQTTYNLASYCHTQYKLNNGWSLCYSCCSVFIYSFESKSILHHRAPHPTQQSALGTPLWHPGPPTTPPYMPHLREGGNVERERPGRCDQEGRWTEGEGWGERSVQVRSSSLLTKPTLDYASWHSEFSPCHLHHCVNPTTVCVCTGIVCSTSTYQSVSVEVECQ